jgi:hypothetical protein
MRNNEELFEKYVDKGNIKKAEKLVTKELSSGNITDNSIWFDNILKITDAYKNENNYIAIIKFYSKVFSISNWDTNLIDKVSQDFLNNLDKSISMLFSTYSELLKNIVEIIQENDIEFEDEDILLTIKKVTENANELQDLIDNAGDVGIEELSKKIISVLLDIKNLINELNSHIDEEINFRKKLIEKHSRKMEADEILLWDDMDSWDFK